MAQETLKSLIQVILTLPLSEQKQVVMELQDNIRRQGADVQPMTREQLLASAEEGLAEIKRGEYYTMDEIDARLDEVEHDLAEGRYYTTEHVFQPQRRVAV